MDDRERPVPDNETVKLTVQLNRRKCEYAVWSLRGADRIGKPIVLTLPDGSPGPDLITLEVFVLMAFGHLLDELQSKRQIRDIDGPA